MITTPTLLLKEDVCRSNIRRMAEKAWHQNVIFRPHFKTHQSKEIGGWFREEGVSKITVSSLKMAAYFAEDNWEDITVAFPVNILEIDMINRLAKKVSLNLLVESTDSVDYLNAKLEAGIKVFIKIDTGTKRTGIQPDNHELIKKIIRITDHAELITFSGFLSHAGHSYDCRSVEEILRVHNEAISIFKKLREAYHDKHPGLIMSAGDTPTCSVAGDFTGVDEIRPGNFIFYDLTQSLIGSCTLDDVAVVMACPVVAKHTDRNELVIYGGAVHFAKDHVEKDGQTVYGQLVENTGNGWGKPIQGSYISKLSQEHGSIHAPRKIIDKCKIGDLVKVIPVHSCTCSNLMKEYVTTDGRVIDRL